jgi:hypothetical protein
MDFVVLRSYESEDEARRGARRLDDGNVECRVQLSGDVWVLEVQPVDRDRSEGILGAYGEITELPPQGTPEDKLPWIQRPGAWLIIIAVVVVVVFLVWNPWLWPFYLVIGVLLGVLYVTSKRSSPDRYSD